MIEEGWGVGGWVGGWVGYLQEGGDSGKGVVESEGGVSLEAFGEREGGESVCVLDERGGAGCQEGLFLFWFGLVWFGLGGKREG